MDDGMHEFEGLHDSAEEAKEILPSPGEVAATPLAGTIDLIRDLHRQDAFAIRQQIRIGNACLAFVRMTLGWTLDMPDKDRKRLETQSARIVKAVETGKGAKPEDAEWLVALGDLILAATGSRAPWDKVRHDVEKRMVKLARTLPGAGFVAETPGLGMLSFARIVGEAGDLGNYPAKGHLWKRFGLAVIDGTIQGRSGLPMTASREHRAAAWTARGYVPRRRSMVYVIGESLIKAQVRAVPDADGEDTGERTALGPHGAAYLARKAYETARDPDMRPAAAHQRAKRYMEKRLLRDLWQAWRREDAYRVPDGAAPHLPPDANHDAAA